MMYNQLLTGTAAEPNSLAMTLVSFAPMILIFVVFYFMLIRPQKKRDKEVQEMRQNLEVGDEIVTIGGIIGLVVSIKEDTIVIETAGERNKIRVARWAIQQNISAAEKSKQIESK